LRDKHQAYDAMKNIPSKAPPPDPTEHPEKITSLLGRLTPKFEKRVAPFKPEWVALKARAAALSDERDAILTALDVIQPEIRREHMAGSAALCRALAGEYGTVAGKVCDALMALGEAAVEHDEWLAGLRKQGAAFGALRPVLVQSPDQFGDPVERIARLLEWAALGGWFDETDIPKSWKERS